jgi:hypothetical protein
MRYYFMHDSVLATLLRKHTWLSDVGIEMSMQNYARDNQPWTIKSTREGNNHYHIRPVPGGWHVRPWKLGVSTQVLSEMASISLT